MAHKHTQIIAFVGMAGAGKSTSAEYLAQKGHPKIYSGGILHEEMRRRGIDITPQSSQAFAEQIRAEGGEDAIVKIGVEQIRNLSDAGQKYIVFDGPYTWSEYRYLKREFPSQITVVAIVAPRKLRHKRLASRAERPHTPAEAIERDFKEIEILDKGGPIAIADHYIINDKGLDDLYEAIDTISNATHFCKAPAQC